jgi:Transposase IS200 like
VHLLVNYPPTVRLSELVNSLKGLSSRRMKQEFPAVPTFWSVRKSKGHLWLSSYFVGSVGGAPITGSPPVHRGPEPAFGRCALSPGPEGPGTSRLLIASEKYSRGAGSSCPHRTHGGYSLPNRPWRATGARSMHANEETAFLRDIKVSPRNSDRYNEEILLNVRDFRRGRPRISRPAQSTVLGVQ